ncbi:T9SS type A sorting domain-containing protein [Winogradskyella aquimaris]|uniref:T9SS type A sorting domain-containing protein n=1 Tax=Winogradskyella aquimaris TaxID=864074 RepID=A0ABU5ES24_9FLAO|nr:T9SS type A sorting domain-containing protein [Winogradskyella aquimaris]MDY2588540.1 T9SS type A sorting domain-containing protein [Winogradskyella aquimaris]
MKKQLLLLILIPLINFSQVQIGNDINGILPIEQLGRSVALSSNGNILAIGANANNGIANSVGIVKVYENINGDWIQIGNDIFGNTSELIGDIVKLSSNGNILVIGGETNSGSGFVRIYENINGDWVQQGNDITSTTNNDNFGLSFSLSSDANIIAVGADSNNSNGSGSGLVRVFENTNGTWIQKGSDFNGANSFEQLGRSVDVSSDGNILAIGIPGESTNGNSSGQVKVYQYNSGTWNQIGQNINGTQIGDLLGVIVGLNSDGTILAIESILDENGNALGGQVEVFEFVNNSWIQIGSAINGLGVSLDISSDGNIIAIGDDINPSSSSGLARIYQNQAGVWTQLGQDIVGNNNSDQFGISVSLSSDGSIVASGAFTANTVNGIGTGYAAVYDLSAELSIQEQTITEFTLYPNPTIDQFTIELNNSEELQNVNIYNNLGQLVQSEKTTTVNTSQLASGLYMVEVETMKGKSTKKLIIK